MNTPTFIQDSNCAEINYKEFHKNITVNAIIGAQFDVQPTYTIINDEIPNDIN